MAVLKDFYEEATQVIFIDPEEELEPWVDEESGPRKIGGIAYKNFIICGECGGVCLIKDVVIVEELSWCPISEEIIGN